MRALPDRFAVIGASIVAGPSLEVVHRGYMLVERGTVVEIKAGPPPEGCDTIELYGHVLVPAFINAHTHLADSALKEVGFGQEEWDLMMPPNGFKHRALAALEESEVVNAMRDSLKLMLRSGTVAFSDFREQGVEGITALNKAAEGLPVIAVTMGRFAVPPYSEEQLGENTAPLPEGYPDELEELIEAAPGFSFVTANDATDVGLRQAGERARRAGRRLAVHVAETEQYRKISVSRTGESDVARALRHFGPDFVIHMTNADEHELDLVAAAAVPVVVCGRIQATLGNGVPPLTKFRERGIPFALATDNAMFASPNLLDELKYMGRVVRAASRDAAWPTARELLAAVTVTPAQVLGVDDRLGWLAPGKCASFVAFDLETDNMYPARDPIASIVNRAETDDIAAVVHEGVVVSGQLRPRGTTAAFPALPPVRV